MRLGVSDTLQTRAAALSDLRFGGLSSIAAPAYRQKAHNLPQLLLSNPSTAAALHHDAGATGGQDYARSLIANGYYYHPTFVLLMYVTPNVRYTHLLKRMWRAACVVFGSRVELFRSHLVCRAGLLHAVNY
jgi:hypothetical protein